MTPLPRRGSLFAKVFVHGLVVLVASNALFLVISAWLVIPKVERDVQRDGRWLALQICGSMPQTDPVREAPPPSSLRRSTHSMGVCETRSLSLRCRPCRRQRSPACKLKSR